MSNKELATRLEELERIITRTDADAMVLVIEQGAAWRTIRDERLYHEAGYTSFDDYCHEHWGKPRESVDRIIRTTLVSEVLAPERPLPSGAVAEGLMPLLDDPNELVRVYDAAVASGRLTGESVKRARLALSAAAEPEVLPWERIIAELEPKVDERSGWSLDDYRRHYRREGGWTPSAEDIEEGINRMRLSDARMLSHMHSTLALFDSIETLAAEHGISAEWVDRLRRVRMSCENAVAWGLPLQGHDDTVDDMIENWLIKAHRLGMLDLVYWAKDLLRGEDPDLARASQMLRIAATHEVIAEPSWFEKAAG